jgi:hypothetical protein
LEPYVGAGLYGAKSPIKVNRLLLMAAVLVLVCVSVIKYGLMTESGPPATEVLELYPLRASEGRTVTLVAGGRIEIHFVVSGYHDGIVSNIRIESSDSSVVYERDVFADFNEMGLGVITLSADRFKVGLYRFIVTDTRTDAVKASYNFRVD